MTLVVFILSCIYEINCQVQQITLPECETHNYIHITVKPAHAVTSIKSNLPIQSPLLSQTCPCSHLYWAFTCIKRPHFSGLVINFYVNWTSFTRSPVLKDHFFFVPYVISCYQFDCIYNYISSREVKCSMFTTGKKAVSFQ